MTTNNDQATDGVTDGATQGGPKRPAPAPLAFSAPRGQVTLERAFKLVTPVFGGGVSLNESAENRHLKDIDPVTPVRTASIRGQLRFWWRATTGCLYDSIREMRRAEAALWGGPSEPGKVSLRLRPSAGKPVGPSPMKIFESTQSFGSGLWNPRPLEGMNDIAYAAFPLQGNAGQQSRTETGVAHKVKGSFTLVVGAPADQREEVDLALDAWLTFGGLGGRTRRGFGAVAPADPAQALSPEDVVERATKAAGATPRTLSEVPSLVGARLKLGRPCGGADVAWRRSLSTFKRFRQGKGFARNKGSAHNRPGRSRWPEADQIRRITRRNSPQHEPHHPVEKFPRAAFGMPIIFHFKDRGDPGDTTLKPRDAHGKVQERLASPLILRPALLSSGQFKPLALVLRVERPAGLQAVLDTGSQGERDVDTGLTAADASRIYPLRDNPDVLGAFLKFFHDQA